MRNRRAVLSLFLALSLLAGCAGTGGQATEWTLTDLKGREHALADYRGQVVLLDFWATWCPPCRAASPAMQKLHDRFRERGFTVIGIHVDQKGDPVKYMKEHGYTYPCMKDGRSVSKAYGVEGIPTFVLLDRDGAIAKRWTGFGPGMEAKFAAAIEQLLDARAD